MSKTVEKLDQMGEQSLDWLKEFTEKGVEFVQTQAPDLCKEIVNLALWQWGFLALMWFVIGVTVYTLGRKLVNHIKEDDPGWAKTGDAKALGVFSVFVSLTPQIGTIISLYNFVTVFAAPKVYLLHYFVTLYNRTKG